MPDNRLPITTRPHFAHHRVQCLCGLLIVALFCALSWLNPAKAGFSVEISVNGGIPTVYLDNAAQDLNLAVGDIEIDFMVSDAFNSWMASGTVLATGGTDTPPVSTIVTDTLIEKLTAGLINGQIAVKHNYAASGIAMHDATIDGQFENTLGNPISYADLFYTANVNTFVVGTPTKAQPPMCPAPYSSATSWVRSRCRRRPSTFTRSTSTSTPAATPSACSTASRYTRSFPSQAPSPWPARVCRSGC